MPLSRFSSSSSSSTAITPSLHALLLLASALLLQLDPIHALPHPAPVPTVANPSTDLPTPSTLADHHVLPQRQDHLQPKAARPFGHPGAAGTPLLLPDPPHVAAAAGPARAAAHPQSGPRGPASRVIFTRKRTRTVTLPVLAVSHATVTAITAVVASARNQQEHENQSELLPPPPILPPTPTVLLLEAPRETLLLDAPATATTPTNAITRLAENQQLDTSHAVQLSYVGALQTPAGDSTGLVPMRSTTDDDRAQQFLELVQSSRASSTGSSGVRAPERKEMGRGSSDDTSGAAAAVAAAVASSSGASQAVTADTVTIDDDGDGTYTNGRSGDDGGTWLWKDEV
ncbi:hypothetical protein B0J12DRAFT_700800 [Macrophomina phaseolina]|uniref:Uncharacterized protein n=1 Tax=Macrophomina phaseolina TaxID=35725 RepID=A0ABQ8G9T6_9PEZI|nr:hypothetical protein B0J12DRAFT_700800 [Macrophomina phaseolina]